MAIRSWAARLVLCAGALLLAGCAQIKLGPPVPSIDNIGKARAAGIAPVALGTFELAPGRDRSLDQKVVARTNTVYSPYDSSFAKYLRENLAVDLGAAGLLEPGSPLVLRGWLTDSQLDAPTGTGRGSVAARFQLVRSGAVAYDKELRASATWPSVFVGVEAISTAMNEYALLYRKLVAALLDDPQFRAAAQR
jgi:hypothetical protein